MYRIHVLADVVLEILFTRDAQEMHRCSEKDAMIGKDC